MHILKHKYMYIYEYAQGPARPTYIHVCICIHVCTYIQVYSVYAFCAHRMERNCYRLRVSQNHTKDKDCAS